MSLQLDNRTRGASAPRETFGGILRDHRRAAGLTQEALAERAGLSPRSISEVERGGDHVPRRDTVALLVRALDLSPTEREVFKNMADDRRPRRAFGRRTDPPQGAPPDEPAKHQHPRA